MPAARSDGLHWKKKAFLIYIYILNFHKSAFAKLTQKSAKTLIADAFYAAESTCY